MGKIKEIIFQESEIDTVLAEDIKFNGTLKFSHSLMIKGEFKGEIKAAEGHLYIGEDARIQGDITADNVTNLGRIHGNLNVKNKFELYCTGSLTGDVSCDDLFVESGSIFNGKSIVKRTEPVKKSIRETEQ